jgi:CTP:molybdopterin cytidylyltransferase MocA
MPSSSNATVARLLRARKYKNVCGASSAGRAAGQPVTLARAVFLMAKPRAARRREAALLYRGVWDGMKWCGTRLRFVALDLSVIADRRHGCHLFMAPS